MAEAIGFAASVIAVVGLAGQVIQGCQNIKDWVGEFNSAPKDIQDLIRELNSIEQSASITDILRTKIDRREVDFQLDPALQRCLDAVQELRKHITDADILFQERGHSRKSRSWQRLKVVLGKRSIQASVDRLSRAKTQLVVVQSNVLLYFSQCQQEQLRDINESLSLGLRTSQNSASTLDCMNNALKGVYYQAEETATAVTSLSADVERYLKEPRQPHNMPDMVATFERTMEKVLQKYTNQPSHSRGGCVQAEPVQCMSISIAEHNTPCQELNAALLRPNYHSKLKFLCQTSVITISKAISIPNMELNEKEETNGVEETREAGHSYSNITNLEILFNIGLWRRGLKAVIGSSRRSCTPGFDFRLSTYHIVDDNAPIFQAAESFDIDTVRTLFMSGQASPFDQNTSGNSLFDWVFCSLCRSYDINDAIRGLKLLKFLFNSGGAPNSLADKRQLGNFPWIEIAMRHWIPPEIQQTVAEATRLIFQTSYQDPISNWNLGICMTLKSQRTPIGEVIRQQDQWPVELRPLRKDFWGGSTAVENDRQIFEDEEGLLMAPLLIEAKDYAAINPTRGGWRTPLGIQSILYLYHDSEWKEEIRTGCKNRIIILLKAGSDPRALRSCPFDERIQGDLEMSVTQFALFTNTFDIWQEALETLGWSRADIDSLLDEEQYLGVPELLSGELEFRSQAENREEFIHTIATGGYDERSKKLAEKLSTYLHMNISDIGLTIQEGYQAFQMTSTPGSWHEDGVLNLVLGVDFFLWKYGWPDLKCYTSFDEYDKR